MIAEMMADMTEEEHRAPGDVWKTPEGKPWVVCGVEVDEGGEELLQLLSMPEGGFVKYTLATTSYFARHGLSPEPRVKVDGSQATSLWQAVVKLGDNRTPVDLPVVDLDG
jgi:hypothetical protein